MWVFFCPYGPAWLLVTLLREALSPNPGGHVPAARGIAADNNNLCLALARKHGSAFAVFTLGRGKKFIKAYAHALAKIRVVNGGGFAHVRHDHESRNRAGRCFWLGGRSTKAAPAEQQGPKKCQTRKCNPGLAQWQMCRKRLHGIPHNAAAVTKNCGGVFFPSRKDWGRCQCCLSESPGGYEYNNHAFCKKEEFMW